MTPEEILLELRDIHLPAAASGSASSPPFAPEPFLLAGAVLAALVFAAWRRATRWRRQARARLAALSHERSADLVFAGMTALAADLSRSGKAGPAPAAAHLPPGRVGSMENAALRRHLQMALGDAG